MNGPFKKDDRVYAPGYGWGVVIGTQNYGFGVSGYYVRFSADPAVQGIYLPDWRVFDQETTGEGERKGGLDPVKSSIEQYVRASGVKLW